MWLIGRISEGENSEVPKGQKKKLWGTRQGHEDTQEGRQAESRYGNAEGTEFRSGPIQHGKP